MSTAETVPRPLADWPHDAVAAYVLEEDAGVIELVVTRDGRALLNGHELRVVQHVRVVEQRAGLAAMGAGRI